MTTLNFDIWNEPEQCEEPLWMLDVPGFDDRPAKALILDADPALCRQVGAALRSLGIQAESYATPDEALAAAGEIAFSVAIVDVGLERGHEVSRALARGDAGRPVPVLAFASGGSFLERLKARRHGCSHYVRKPAPLERFLRAVWKTAKTAREHDAEQATQLPSSA